MTIEEMHYDFNEQLKIADNVNYQKLLGPQIDFVLNKAAEVYTKMCAFPMYNPIPKFESTHRTKNNIHTLVVDSATFSNTFYKFDDNNYLYTLPSDCFIFLGGTVRAINGSCYKDIKLYPVLQETITTTDYTAKSSFIWEEVNYRIIDKGVKIEIDDFSIIGVKPLYIKKPKYMHYADKFKEQFNRDYRKLDGTVLTGKLHCDLPYVAHPEIVNIAVLLTKMDLGMDINAQILKLKDIN